MTSYKEIAIDDEILTGDIITIKGPNEHDTTVREVSEDKTVLIGDSEFSLHLLLENYYSYMTITKIERSVPEVELPTRPGYYESAKFPIAEGYGAYWLTHYDRWRFEGDTQSNDRMLKLMPLTLLVPETEVKRPEVDAETVKLRHILEGKFDK